MSVKKCQHYCCNWADVCANVCKRENLCGLTNDVDARRFSRCMSCKTKCVGFNMHGDEHCTLFSSNVDLLSGGRATFYTAPGVHYPPQEMQAAVKKKAGSEAEGGNNNIDRSSGNIPLADFPILLASVGDSIRPMSAHLS